MTAPRAFGAKTYALGEVSNSQAAHKLESPRLAALAVKVRLDALERVKRSIDDMVAALLKEKADEIKHKGSCIT